MNVGKPGGLWRVEGMDRGQCTVLGLQDDGSTVRQRVLPGSELLTVGDWVALEDSGDDLNPLQVAFVLERRSLLRRGSVHKEGEQQLLAANLDTVFVVAAFAATDKLQRRAIRARRLDRFIAAVVEGGATPVVVLNKVDIAREDVEARETLCNNLCKRLGGVEVVCASAVDAGGLSDLSSRISAGDTVALVGPSGVGKSSLTNALLGSNAQIANKVRARDAKGRHTTTRSSLIQLPGDALIIDTPGVRQFAILADDEVLGFSDIEELTTQCRFSDCGHGDEPGCAVRDAVANGTLLEDRLESYLQIQLDSQRLQGRRDKSARHQQRSADRRFALMVRAGVRDKRSR